MSSWSYLLLHIIGYLAGQKAALQYIQKCCYSVPLALPMAQKPQGLAGPIKSLNLGMYKLAHLSIISLQGQLFRTGGISASHSYSARCFASLTEQPDSQHLTNPLTSVYCSQLRLPPLLSIKPQVPWFPLTCALPIGSSFDSLCWSLA